DLRIEARNRTALLTAIVFAILVQLIFVFSREPGSVSLEALAPGVLWVILALAGLVVQNRAFLLEREHAALEAILLAPVPRTALFWGKWLANVTLVLVVMISAMPLWVLFFNVTPAPALFGLFAMVILAALGFIGVGTLLSAMTARTRYAELLLPVLLLPFVLPPIFAGASGAARLLAGRPFGEIVAWLRMLVLYDLAYLTLASLLFTHVVDE
ncbi:MAG TPA: heme exporter protein CcmB, partial [Gemmatimonadales bacterium]|nr:heme exporter protein CcmB [Gemmatimonadales bacterium]